MNSTSIADRRSDGHLQSNAMGRRGFGGFGGGPGGRGGGWGDWGGFGDNLRIGRMLASGDLRLSRSISSSSSRATATT